MFKTKTKTDKNAKMIYEWFKHRRFRLKKKKIRNKKIKDKIFHNYYLLYLIRNNYLLLINTF